MKLFRLYEEQKQLPTWFQQTNFTLNSMLEFFKKVIIKYMYYLIKN